MKIAFDGSLKNIVKEMEEFLFKIKDKNRTKNLTPSKKKMTKSSSLKIPQQVRRRKILPIGQNDRPRDEFYNLVNDNWDKLKNIPGNGVNIRTKKIAGQSADKLKDGTLINTNYSNERFKAKIRYVKELLGIWK
jgi:hypothetical protein